MNHVSPTPQPSIDWLLEFARGNDAGTQSVSWRPDAWKREFSGMEPFIESLSRNAETRHASITRATVYELAAVSKNSGARTDRNEAFLAIMIWGRGPDNRGPRLTRRMMESDAFESVLAEIIEASQGTDTSAAFLSLYSHRRPRIRGLGTSFGTKLLHVFGFHPSGVQPLVYDQLVSNALRELSRRDTGTQYPAAPSPWRFMKAAEYQRYCEWAAALADKANVSPASVEFALFTLGKSLK